MKSIQIQLEHFAVSDGYSSYKIPSSFAQMTIERLHKEAQRPGPRTERNIKEAIEKWPDLPQLENFLCVMYQIQGCHDLAKKAAEKTLEKFPDYLFARAAMLQLNSNWEETEVFRLLGPTLELHDLYPDRTVFHPSEVAQFYGCAIRFLLGKGDLATAEKKFKTLEKGAPGSAELERVMRLMMVARMEKMRERLAKDELRRRDSVHFSTITVPALSARPVFFHPEIEQLYRFSEENLPVSVQNELLRLPRTSLIADLKRVLRDSICRLDWFEKNTIDYEEEVMSFPIHALRFLGILEARESLQSVLDVLRVGQKFAEFWFGERTLEFIQAPLFLIGQHDLPALQRFVFEKNVWQEGKTIAIQVVEQVAMHHPERREACVEWLRTTFDFFLEKVDDENLFDSWIIGSLVGVAISWRATEFMPRIEHVFELEVIGEMNFGDFSAVKKMMTEAWGAWEIEPMPESIETFYSKEYKKRRVRNPSLDDFDEEFDPNEMHVLADLFNQRNPPLMLKKAIAPVKSTALQNVGRNDPCPCGSGKKFKKCHGG